MEKKWIISIIIVIILGLILGIAFAIFSENMRKTEDSNIISREELADVENQINNEYNNENLNTLETSSTENTISPNAMLIEKVYYEACDHLIRKNLDVPEELVNKTEEDIKKTYSDWEIEEFSPTRIVLYKTSKDNCGEHYLVQEHNGVIGIYTIDEYGVKTLKEDTEILTQYLPEADIQKLMAGVEIIGNTKLIEFLEDYE